MDNCPHIDGIERGASEISEELTTMAQHATDERTHNQPNQEAQVKGGEHSHQNQSTKGTSSSHNQPSHEAQVKGGQHSHQGSENRADESANERSHNQPSHEAQVKGGQHSHAGGAQR